MITFIIPIIHPKHKRIDNYNNILDCLKTTVFNLLSIKVSSNIIVICHKKPDRDFESNKNVIFIELNSIIFELLRKLDENSDLKHYYLSNRKFRKYLKYLSLGGKYHNKDKGLKYFIGLLYLKYLPHSKKPEFVGLIDGDDFIHQDIGQFLTEIPNNYNEILINHGYLYYKNENKLYRIEKFSNICGSNRFFRYHDLEKILHNTLNINYTPYSKNNLVYNYKVTDTLINDIMNYINYTDNVKKLNIFPMFLGCHRYTWDNNHITNYLHNQFKVIYMNHYAAIKLFHDDNHSKLSDKKQIDKLIERYLKKKIMKPNKYQCNNKNNILEKFNINQN